MVFSILFVAELLLHPFHVSVSEVKYKEDIKSIQISTRIFLDDLEIGLRTYSRNEKLDIVKRENWDFVNEQLGRYLLENFKVFNEKGQLEAKYLGAEIEDDVMWAYIEIEKVKKLRTVTIWNSILTETYEDQENLIHFRAFGKVKSARHFKGKERQTYEWENTN